MMNNSNRLNTIPRRVAITGYGCVTPLGNTAAESWDSIINYRCGYRAWDAGDASIKAKFFGKVEIDDKSFKRIPAAVRRALPRFARYTALAADEALNMAFGENKPCDIYAAIDCGVIIGTGWGGLDEANECHDRYLTTGFGSPLGSLLTMPNVATAACSLIWELRGYQNTPVAACATGTMAIGDAANVIRSGRAKMMLAGGAEALNSRTNVWNIDILQALSKEQTDVEKACCPFSKARSGFVLSEGAAVVVLEDLESAQRRGARIFGEITGYGNFSDARDFTAPAEDRVSRVTAIRAAMSDAGIEASQIGYINAHGTSTPLNDENETASIKEALSDAAYRIPVSSTKSYSGHLIAAAGSFEAIVCLKVIETGLIPATIHLNEPDPACDLDYVPNRHREARVDTALNLSFGFGGANAALIIQGFKS